MNINYTLQRTLNICVLFYVAYFFSIQANAKVQNKSSCIINELISIILQNLARDGYRL